LSVTELYANTVYVLALAAPSHWAKDNAEKLRSKTAERKLDVWTSETTLHEVLMFTKEEGLDPIQFITSVLGVVRFVNVDTKVILKAAYFMREYQLDAADSIHVAHALEANAALITTDRKIQSILKTIEGARFDL